MQVWASLLFFAAVASAKILHEDEFNSNSLDTSKWALEVLASPYNNELEYYTDRSKNVRVEDGHLIITPLKENYGGRQYTSARMHSKFHWKYGRVEVRAKLPNGFGLWPAIWMMPEDSVYGGWPASGEIDIMEARGQNLDVIASNIHYGTRNPDGSTGSHYHMPSGGMKTGCSIDEFHVYTFDWTPTQMTYRLDGKAYFVHDLNNIENNWMYSGPGEPFDQDFHMILNVAIGGDYLDNPTSSTKWDYPDAEMWVDYVRVYPLEDISTYQCATKLSTSEKDVCYQIKYVCGPEQTWADVSSECTTELLDCCSIETGATKGDSCSAQSIITMANAVFKKYDTITNTCAFSGYAERTYVLDDGPVRMDLEGDQSGGCFLKDNLNTYQMCGGLNSACYDGCKHGYSSVKQACKDEKESIECCKSLPTTCKYGTLQDAAQNVFTTYHQSVSSSNCEFGGVSYSTGGGPLEPLQCTDGYNP